MNSKLVLGLVAYAIVAMFLIYLSSLESCDYQSLANGNSMLFQPPPFAASNSSKLAIDLQEKTPSGQNLTNPKANDSTNSSQSTSPPENSSAISPDYSNQNQEIALREGFELSEGWTITSYYNANESLFKGQKVAIFDYNHQPMGSYKSDFLAQVRIEGSGIGDGINNPGKMISYDFNLNDSKTYYFISEPRGAYNTPVFPWTDPSPTIAINPPLPNGTEVLFINLGPDSSKQVDWAKEILMSKKFYVADTFFGFPKTEKKIDIYIGSQQRLDETGPESLFMRNVTIALKVPKAKIY